MDVMLPAASIWMSSAGAWWPTTNTLVPALPASATREALSVVAIFVVVLPAPTIFKPLFALSTKPRQKMIVPSIRAPLIGTDGTNLPPTTEICVLSHEWWRCHLAYMPPSKNWRSMDAVVSCVKATELVRSVIVPFLFIRFLEMGFRAVVDISAPYAEMSLGSRYSAVPVAGSCPNASSRIAASEMLLVLTAPIVFLLT